MAKRFIYGTILVENISVGTPNGDDSDDYFIYTYGGDDFLNLYVDGSLLVDAGTGNDMLYGDSDSDNDDIAGGDGVDTIYGGIGNDALNGNAGEDFIIGDAGNDTIYGGSEDDYINGGQGYDTIHGEDGADTIRGGDLNDFIYGNAGNDKLHGEMGGDVLFGGEGADRFVYGSAAHSRVGSVIDQIRDFTRGEDKVDLLRNRRCLCGNR